MHRNSLIVLSLLLLSLPSWAATCTASGSGNWTDTSKWSCGHAPVSGDTVVINTPNTITVNTSVTVGLDDGATAAITGTGTLDVTSNCVAGSCVSAVLGTVHYKGDISISTLTVEQGGGLDHQSPNSHSYKVTVDSGKTATFNGKYVNTCCGAAGLLNDTITSARIRLTSSSGTAYGLVVSGTGTVTGSFFDVSDWQYIQTDQSSGSSVKLDHFTFTRGTSIISFNIHANATYDLHDFSIVDPTSPSANFVIDYCFTGSTCETAGTGYSTIYNFVTNAGQVRLGGGTGVHARLSFHDFALWCPHTGTLESNNYSCLATSSTQPIFDNSPIYNGLIFHDRATGVNTVYNYIPPGTFKDVFVIVNDRACLADRIALGNPFLNNNVLYQAQARSTVYDGITFDVLCSYGSMIINSQTGGTAPWTLEVKNSLIIPDPNPLTYGYSASLLTMESSSCTQSGSNYCANASVHNNTYPVAPYLSSGAGGIASEEFNGFNGEYTKVQDNIVYNLANAHCDVSPDCGSIITNLGSPAANGLYSNVDHNWLWNVGNGLSGDKTAYRNYASGGASGGGIYATAIGEVGGGVSPQFYDNTTPRRFLTWCQTLNSLDATLDDCWKHWMYRGSSSDDTHYNISALLQYVRNGVRPGNASVKTASSTGSYVGAVSPTPTATTWYVRPDGGVRQNTTNATTNYCDGTHDAAASGHSTTDHQCAFSNPYYLWTNNETSAAYITATGSITSGLATMTTSSPHGFTAGSTYVIMFLDQSQFTNTKTEYSQYLYLPTKVLTTPSSTTFTTKLTNASGQDLTGPISGTCTGCSGVRAVASWDWIVAAGDTVIIKNNSNGSQANYRMGQGGTVWNLYQDLGDFGQSAYMPPIPSGYEGQPTKFVGEGYNTGCSVKPQLWSSNGASFNLNLFGSSYVDTECLEVTDHSTCIWTGSPPSANFPPYTACSYADGEGRFGAFIRKSQYAVLRNLDIHGMPGNGIQGGMFNSLTIDHVNSSGHAGMTFAMDDNNLTKDMIEMQNAGLCEGGQDSTCSVNIGQIDIGYLTSIFSGIVESYPRTTYGYNYWNNSGDADCVQAAITRGNWHLHHSTFRGCASDNVDMVYIGHCVGRLNGQAYCQAQGPGTYDNNATLLVEYNDSRTPSKGALKGSGYQVTFRNNVSIDDCKSFWDWAASSGLYPATILDYHTSSDGIKSGCVNSTNAGLGETTAVNYYTKPGGYLIFQNNTIGTQNEALVIGCSADYPSPFWDKSCSGRSDYYAVIENNLFWGDGAASTWSGNWLALYVGSDAGAAMYSNTGASRKNNLWYQGLGTYSTTSGIGTAFSPNTNGASGEVTTNPRLATITPMYLVNAQLLSGSGAIGNGITIPAVTNDYAGNARTVPYDIGAFAFTGLTPPGGGTQVQPNTKVTTNTIVK